MKTFLSILLFFITYNCLSQTDSTESKIANVHPYKFVVSDDFYVLVAENDFPKRMTWRKALDECRKLGEGWHLPTISELSYLQQNDSTHIFSKEDYWTNSSFLFLRGSINFKNGKGYYSSKNNYYRVRAIWHDEAPIKKVKKKKMASS